MKAFPNVFMDYMPAAEHRGMDLRDYFAAKAMQGFAADPEIDAGSLEVAELAYKWADAMMKVREQ